MKTLRILCALLLVAVSATVASAQTARLQVIHNAADPAAATVDIYVNGGLFLNDFDFRKATPFVDVPAGVTLNIGVAPGTSTSAADVIATIPVTLEAGKTYVAIANGVLDPSGFSANPDAKPIGFALFPRDGIREKAWYPKSVNLIVFHGATDAPGVDVRVKGLWFPLINDLYYGQFSTYRSLFPASYQLNITPANDPNTVVASFRADLSGLAGGAAVVFASGFLNPAANQNGPAFGLYAALPNGTVVALPAIMTMAKARLQIIHNAADPAAEEVDIYVNGDLTLDNFAFRTATPFIDIPAGVTLNIGVAPANSSSAADAIATIPVQFENGKTYVAIANGVVQPGFAPNPSGNSIGFTIFARDGIVEKALTPWLVRVIAFHGATDAPEVDVVPQLGSFRWPLFDNLEYGEFSSYRALPPYRYVLDVTPSNANNTVVASFVADLRGLGGKALVVFASGFLSPAANLNGPAFGLFAALADGTVVELPAYAPVAATTEETSQALAKTSTLPDEFALNQNYPNPFNPATTISFALPQASSVKLTVYNVIGQEVATLADGAFGAGQHTVEFDASPLSSGMYFYRLTTESFTETKKMVLLK